MRRLWNGFRHPVRGKDHRRIAVWHFVELPTNTAPFALKVFHHVAVVNDLVAHIDRRAVQGQGPLHRIDGANDARAKPARGAKQDVQGRLGHDPAMWRDGPHSVKRRTCILWAAGMRQELLALGGKSP